MNMALFLAWYLGTGVLFAELLRTAAKQQSVAIWRISWFVVVCGWIAIIPPIVHKNWRM